MKSCRILHSHRRRAEPNEKLPMRPNEVLYVRLGRTRTSAMETIFWMVLNMLYQRFGLRPSRMGKQKKLIPFPRTLAET